jgi:putative MATE family efflux protein
MRASANDLTTGSVGGHLRRQATPFALSLVAIFSFEAIDLFFISRLGEAALAAVSFTFPVIWLIYAIGIGFEAAAASCVSRAVGRKDSRLAARLTTDTVVLASGVALVLCVIGLASIDAVFTMLGATAEVIPLIREYMTTWYWVAPLDVALWASLASIRARGNTLLESKIITSAAILNTILDPLLIFGLLGFPKMGIQGAALATVISTAIMLAFTLYHLHFHLGVYASPVARLREILDSWRHMLAIGIPAIATNAIIPLSNGIVVAMIAQFGVEAVGGFGVAMRIEPIFLIPFYALSAVASPFFGQNYGSGRFDRMFEARRILTRFCAMLGLGLAVLLAAIAVPLTGLFSDAGPIQDVAVRYLWIVPLSYGAYGMVMSVNAAFNGSGRPMPGVAISTLRVIVVFLPLAFLGRYLFGLEGMFAASTLANLSIGLVAYLWLGRHIAQAAGEPGQNGVRNETALPP